MKVQDLLNQDHPQCLYCSSALEIKVVSDAASFPIYNSVTIYTCTVCKEIFEISTAYSDLNEEFNTESIASIGLSCNDISILINYIDNICYISHNMKHHDRLSYLVSVPIFELDFSNKDKLYQKLKTYLLFS